MSRSLVLPLLLVLATTLAACAGILGIKPKNLEHPFEHRAHVLKGIPCVECHDTIRTASESGPLHFPTTEKCTSCHQKPHDTRACNACHGEARLREEASLAREHLRFTHAEHTPRLDGQCVPCHAAVGKNDASTLRPPMAQCFTCHEHRDQWTTRNCDGCHVALPAEHVTPSSHVVHDGDFVREHGVRAASSRDLCSTCHSESFCLSCHGVTVAALPWKFQTERPTLAGLHRAGFRMRHADEARANPGLCATCHEPATFCADCHADKHVGAAPGSRSPHPPGWVRARGGDHGRAARLDPVACASCHGGAGEALCVGCHRVGGVGGNPHGPGFSSRLDKTRDVPCRQCHAP
ncbi:Cytochrome c family protein [Labilithrix luteola]|uniref:Cytochrome c family protein n=1 Tax=Labilithrix luteola TaxID=1391654 RepID=A0A0K1Q407_9BACT|nr:cytochrome c3 family protein [Labilithrix luteola]AKV00464.1 Cytochrome c family protein [Labilithrix luteola]